MLEKWIGQKCEILVRLQEHIHERKTSFLWQKGVYLFNIPPTLP